MERTPKKEKSYEVDLTVPIDRSMIKEKDDCFGKMWDMTSKECPQCADRDICSILFKDKVDAKAKKIEEDLGSKFLDEADFDNLTSESLYKFIESGKTTSRDLLMEAMRLTNCDDVIAVKNKVMEWVKANDSVSIKQGVVWLK